MYQLDLIRLVALDHPQVNRVKCYHQAVLDQLRVWDTITHMPRDKLPAYYIPEDYNETHLRSVYFKPELYESHMRNRTDIAFDWPRYDAYDRYCLRLYNFTYFTPEKRMNESTHMAIIGL
jgi:hypothetical protein